MSFLHLFLKLCDAKAAGAEEDLVLSQQLIDRLRGELAQKHSQLEAFKKVVLELEVDASEEQHRLSERLFSCWKYLSI